MSFGDELTTQFNKLTGGIYSLEVDLFTKLQDAFINLKDSCADTNYVIDIIHGSKSQVGFNNTSSYINSIKNGELVNRELSDMMFIVFSRSKSQLRLSYIQNKKGEKSRFKADLMQLHLLKDKPTLVGNLPDCVFNDASILAKSQYTTLCGYGTFFMTSNKQIDMSYFPAKFLNPLRLNGNSKIRKVKYDEHYFGKCSSGSIIESFGEDSLKSFGDSLIDMKIGELFAKGSSEYKTIITCLNSYSRFMREYSDNQYYDEPLLFNQFSIPVLYILNGDYNK